MSDGTQEHPFSVSGFTSGLKTLIEKQFTKIFVEGEISGFKIAASGHVYFSLKDEGAQVSAVMFKANYDACCRRNPALATQLKDGAKVLVYANATVYPARGNYQLMILAVKLQGEGDLMARYLELKSRLEKEGLFDSSRKRQLPFLPRRIGIVTSPSGAVIHDMCTVLTRRFPALEIRLFPCQVQGTDAPEGIIAGIEYFNSESWNPDLIIIARGGGSFEDLFCFNDELLVRTVAASKVPTISAVGHETDFTLCDFAADKRAGTPSIAAEIAVPVQEEIERKLIRSLETLAGALKSREQYYTQRVDHLSESLGTSLAHRTDRVSQVLAHLAQRLPLALSGATDRATQRLGRISDRLPRALNLSVERSTARLDKASTRLGLLSPYSVLERGYSLTIGGDGEVVRDASKLSVGDRVVTRFMKGSAEMNVERMIP